MSGNSPWAYTIDLSSHGQHEFVIAGIDLRQATVVLNTAGHLAIRSVDINGSRALADGFGHDSVLLELKAVHATWHATHLLDVGRAYLGSDRSTSRGPLNRRSRCFTAVPAHALLPVGRAADWYRAGVPGTCPGFISGPPLRKAKPRSARSPTASLPALPGPLMHELAGARITRRHRADTGETMQHSENTFRGVRSSTAPGAERALSRRPLSASQGAHPRSWKEIRVGGIDAGGFTAIMTLANFLTRFADALADDEKYVDQCREEDPYETPPSLLDGAAAEVWKFAAEQGLQRIDGKEGEGDEAAFIPGIHHCEEGVPTSGARVKIVSPGWLWQIPGGNRTHHVSGLRGWRWKQKVFVVRKAVVENVTPDGATSHSGHPNPVTALVYCRDCTCALAETAARRSPAIPPGSNPWYCQSCWDRVM